MALAWRTIAPPVTTLNLAQFWQLPGTERVSTRQTLSPATARTDPLLVPPFLKKLCLGYDGIWLAVPALAGSWLLPASPPGLFVACCGGLAWRVKAQICALAPEPAQLLCGGRRFLRRTAANRLTRSRWGARAGKRSNALELALVKTDTHREWTAWRLQSLCPMIVTAATSGGWSQPPRVSSLWTRPSLSPRQSPRTRS
jgi:hypothetical protein